MVRNLPKGINPDMLFKLFGVYGNVMKIKIFYKNSENSLIQFQDEFQAVLAKNNLNNCPLFDKNIYVNISQFGYIYPNVKCNEQGLLKDYTNSTEHRYKK